MFNQGEYVFRGIFFLLFICPHFFPCKKTKKQQLSQSVLKVLLNQSLFLSAQGAVLCGGSRCEHHLQQDPGTGPPSESPLPDSPRRHHSHWRRRPAGHQWVSVPVPLRPLELLGPGREDCLWTRAESRSVCLKLGFFSFASESFKYINLNIDSRKAGWMRGRRSLRG